jgi:hypothetical protein
MSEEIVSEFIARLQGIGMSDEQILDTVRDKIGPAAVRNEIDPNTVRDGNNNEHKEVT